MNESHDNYSECVEILIGGDKSSFLKTSSIITDQTSQRRFTRNLLTNNT